MRMPYYDGGDNGLWVFLLVTVFIGGAGAFLSGRAIAQTWRPYWHLPLYMLGIAATVRFFHYALFGGVLLSLRNFVVEFAVVLAAATLGYRLVRASQMVRQYPWLLQRKGRLGWRRAG